MLNRIRRIFQKKSPQFSITKGELKQILPDDAVILEAGVCDGRDTLEFANEFPRGTIYGFECEPNFYKEATLKVGSRNNVKLFPLALSDKDGLVSYHVSILNNSITGSGSILPPKLHTEIHPDIKFPTVITVEATTIQNWAIKNNVQRIDFMWLDLQGAELKALHGAGEILDSVSAIFTEVSLIETYDGVPLYGELKRFLSTRGFRVEREFLPYKDMGNVFFVR
jgi:2-O-methyltransferase